MKKRIGVLFALALCAPALGVPALAAGHDKAYWKAMAERKYAPPEGADVKELTAELSGLLGSTDPELRDDVAYTTLAVWIYKDHRVDEAGARGLMSAWLANLSAGLGETGTDSVFRRSFSALSLATIAALDNEKPFLTQDEFDRFLTGALDYLAREKDLRDHDAVKGWMHATAHTADLLKMLSRSSKLRKEQQAKVVDGIAARLSSAGLVFTHGEEERLARALLSLVRRKDYDPAPLEAWLARLPGENKALWNAPKLDPARYAAMQNAKGCLKSLCVFVAADTSGSIPEGVKAKLLETLVRL